MRNECADHVAVLGALDFVSNHTMSTHVGHTLVLTQLTSSEAAATLLKFITDCVTLVVNVRHRRRLVPCYHNVVHTMFLWVCAFASLIFKITL